MQHSDFIHIRSQRRCTLILALFVLIHYSNLIMWWPFGSSSGKSHATISVATTDLPSHDFLCNAQGFPDKCAIRTADANISSTEKGIPAPAESKAQPAQTEKPKVRLDHRQRPKHKPRLTHFFL